MCRLPRATPRLLHAAGKRPRAQKRMQATSRCRAPRRHLSSASTRQAGLHVRHAGAVGDTGIQLHLPVCGWKLLAPQSHVPALVTFLAKPLSALRLQAALTERRMTRSQAAAAQGQLPPQRANAEEVQQAGPSAGAAQVWTACSRFKSANAHPHVPAGAVAHFLAERHSLLNEVPPCSGIPPAQQAVGAPANPAGEEAAEGAAEVGTCV